MSEYIVMNEWQWWLVVTLCPTMTVLLEYFNKAVYGLQYLSNSLIDIVVEITGDDMLCSQLLSVPTVVKR